MFSRSERAGCMSETFFWFVCCNQFFFGNSSLRSLHESVTSKSSIEYKRQYKTMHATYRVELFPLHRTKKVIVIIAQLIKSFRVIQPLRRVFTNFGFLNTTQYNLESRFHLFLKKMYNKSEVLSIAILIHFHCIPCIS